MQEHSEGRGRRQPGFFANRTRDSGFCRFAAIFLRHVFGVKKPKNGNFFQKIAKEIVFNR